MSIESNLEKIAENNREMRRMLIDQHIADLAHVKDMIDQGWDVDDIWTNVDAWEENLMQMREQFG